MEKFEVFCRNVCANTPRATAAERQSITDELTAHMEDHYDAMIARGVPEDEALDRAVLEMGDAREIGRGINASLSPFWLWLSRITMLLLVIIIVNSLLPTVMLLTTVYDNLEARFMTANDVSRPNDREIVYTDCDIELEVSGHIVKVLSYGTCVNEDTGQYGVHFDTVTYANNPLAPCNDDLLHYLKIEVDPAWDTDGTGSGYSSSGGSARGDSFTPVPWGTENVKLVFHRYGYDYETELELDWGDSQ